MTTLTIHPVSDDQETAIRIFLDALHVNYDANEVTDDTTYLTSSPENLAHLQKSMKQAQNGETTGLSLDDIWKL